MTAARSHSLRNLAWQVTCLEYWNWEIYWTSSAEQSTLHKYETFTLDFGRSRFTTIIIPYTSLRDRCATVARFSGLVVQYWYTKLPKLWNFFQNQGCTVGVIEPFARLVRLWWSIQMVVSSHPAGDKRTIYYVGKWPASLDKKTQQACVAIYS